MNSRGMRFLVIYECVLSYTTVVVVLVFVWSVWFYYKQINTAFDERKEKRMII